MPPPRAIIEHHSLLRYVDIPAAWNGTQDIGNLRRYSTIQGGLDFARDAMANGTYHDVHSWIFAPVTFAELCLELAELDLLGLACSYVIETPRNEAEFYVSMVGNASKAEVVASWARMRAPLLKSTIFQKG